MLDSIVDMSLVCKESYQNVSPVSASVSDLRMCVGHSPSGYQEPSAWEDGRPVIRDSDSSPCWSVSGYCVQRREVPHQADQLSPHCWAMNCPYLASLLSLLLLCFADEDEKMCPGGRRWCEDPVSYPDHVVTSLVNSSHPLWRDLAQPEHQPRHHKHHQRHFFPLDKSSQPACQTNEYYIVPRATRNNKEQWRFILNTGDDNPRYKQVMWGVGGAGWCWQVGPHCAGGEGGGVPAHWPLPGLLAGSRDSVQAALPPAQAGRHHQGGRGAPGQLPLPLLLLLPCPQPQCEVTLS